MGGGELLRSYCRSGRALATLTGCSTTIYSLLSAFSRPCETSRRRTHARSDCFCLHAVTFRQDSPHDAKEPLVLRAFPRADPDVGAPEAPEMRAVHDGDALGEALAAEIPRRSEGRRHPGEDVIRIRGDAADPEPVETCLNERALPPDGTYSLLRLRCAMSSRASAAIFCTKELTLKGVCLHLIA